MNYSSLTIVTKMVYQIDCSAYVGLLQCIVISKYYCGKTLKREEYECEGMVAKMN